MANGLDKLERLFSTRKKAASSRHTAEPNIYASPPDPLQVAQAHRQAQAQSDAQGHAQAHVQSLSSSSSSSSPSPSSDCQSQSQLQLQHHHQSQPESPPCHFPPTPFIRPKASVGVMQPRNELSISSPQSVRTDSSSSRSQRLSSTFSFDSSTKDTMSMSEKRRQSTYSTTASFHVPSRTSSLLSRRHDRVPAGLIQLHLPSETTTSAEDFPDASVFPLKQETHRAPKCLLDALPIYPAARVETPPPSDQDEFTLPSPPQRGQNPSTTTLIQLTPEPSPDMIPRRDSVLSEPKSSSDIQRDKTYVPPSRRITASSIPLLEDDWRDSYVHEPDENISPKTKIVVREPAVEDFLTLTDDDIAEVKIEHLSKPPSKRAPPPPVLPPSARSRSSFASAKRSPDRFSSAFASSEVAAWEAARIAKKYDFDVVYVANFWPSRAMNHLHTPREAAVTAPTKSASAPTSAVSSSHSSFSRSFTGSVLSSPASDRFPLITNNTTTTTHTSTPRNSIHGTVPSPLYRTRMLPPPDLFASARTSPPVAAAGAEDCCPGSGTRAGRTGRGGMSGSLLAAYGLETIAAPFRLSSRVHKKILRTEGWIEHRRSDAAENEFARGYARSFHTGWGPSSSSASTTLSTARAAPRSRSLPSSAAPGVEEGARSSIDGEQPEDKNNKHNNKKIDRGIVFVAYRRPRGPGGTVHSSAAELGALEREAETLVELILDFHGERRRWESFQEAARRAGDV